MERYTVVNDTVQKPYFSCNGSGIIPSIQLYFQLLEKFNQTTHFIKSQRPLVIGDEIPYTVAFCFVFILAVTGNTLVIATLIRKITNVTDCFLMSLAISDLMLAIFCIPITVVGRLLKRFVFGTLVCKGMSYLMGVSVAVSTFTMLAISVERYYAICRPLKSRSWQTRSHACRLIGVIWTLSLILLTPVLWQSQLSYRPLLVRKECVLVCRTYFSSNNLRKIWYLYTLVTLFLIPGGIMSVSYSVICKKIYQGFKFQAKMKKKNADTEEANGCREVTTKNDAPKLEVPQHVELRTRQGIIIGRIYRRVRSMGTFNKTKSATNQELRKRRKVVEMLIIILVLFFLCWTPLYIINVWRAFSPQTARFYIGEFVNIIQLMSYISTCVNPIVYCFLNKRFRKSFYRQISCCGKTISANKMQLSTMNTQIPTTNIESSG